MLSAVIYIVLITSAAAAIATGFNLRIGHAYMPAICLTGIASAAMLVFGIANAVPYVMGVIGILCIGFTVFRIIRQKKRAYYVFTTEFLVFTVIAIGAILLNWGRMYYLTDEFSHWGLAVKNVFTLGKLPFSTETNALFRNYPPFATALCYLGTCFGSEFCEGATFVPMDLLLFASLLPIVTGYMRQCARRGCAVAGRCIAAIPAGAMFFFILCFKLSALTSIAVDTLLGLMAFYVVWECIQAKRRIQIVSAVAAALALALVKDTGLAFAYMAAIIIVAAIIAKNAGQKSPKKTLLDCLERGIPVLLGATTVKLLWNYVMILTNAVDPGPGRFSLLMKTVFGGYGELQAKTTKAFFEAFMKPTISVGIPLAAVICVFALAQLGIILLMKKMQFEGIRTAAAVFAALPACFLAYCFGLLGSYWTVFSETEALSVASFERYIGSYLTLWLSMIGAVAVTLFLPPLIKFIQARAKKPRLFKAVLTVISAAVTLCIALVFAFAYPYKASSSAAFRQEADYGNDIPALCKEAAADRDDTVLFVASDPDVRVYLIANYNASPFRLVPADRENPETAFGEDGAEFIYFYDTEDNDLISGLLQGIDIPGGGSPEAGKLYRVKRG